ncbi:hypothetical protein HWV62_22018 [Athelia sp. TMB]|nr:hypothetical protein HWV62_22018 [Athelia sp. TMB]
MPVSDELLDAMDVASSPIRDNTTGQKRARASSDADFDHSSTASPVLEHNPFATNGPMPSISHNIVNGNTSQAIKKYAQQKRLRADQQTDVEKFLTDTSLVREAKMYVEIQALSNSVNKIVTAAPAFVPTENFKKNVRGMAMAVLCTKNLPGYKKNSTNETILLSIQN